MKASYISKREINNLSPLSMSFVAPLIILSAWRLPRRIWTIFCHMACLYKYSKFQKMALDFDFLEEKHNAVEGQMELGA